MRKLLAYAGLMVGAAILPAGFAGLAWAQTVPTPPDVLIETRQSGQDLIYGIITDMKAAVAAKAEVKPFADNASAMERWFKNFPSLFPAGTETGHDTKAKPDVFSDKAGFEKAAMTASAAAGALAAAAKSGDQAEFAAKFKELGAACGACHRTYKVRT